MGKIHKQFNLGTDFTVGTHISLLVSTQLAIRLQIQDLKPWTPWQRIVINKNNIDEYFKEIRMLQSHIKTHKLYDNNSKLSVHNEKNFYQMMQGQNVKDQEQLTTPKSYFQLAFDDLRFVWLKKKTSQERMDKFWLNSPH